MNIGNGKSRVSSSRQRSHRTGIAHQADQVYNEAKKLGTQIYDEGRDKLDELQENLKERSDKIAQKVYENPVTSLCIAAGVGYILARILRR